MKSSLDIAHYDSNLISSNIQLAIKMMQAIGTPVKFFFSFLFFHHRINVPPKLSEINCLWMNWIVKATPPVLLYRCELELLPLQYTVGCIRERMFSFFTYFRRKSFAIKVYLPWPQIFRDVHMSAFHTISCLQYTEPSRSPVLNLLHKMVLGLLDTNWMSKVWCYDAVMLPGSQQLSCENLNYIHITRVCVEYLNSLSCCAFIL